MPKPLVSFICWNRAGLTARNLLALLESTDDFELHIVDSNSLDNTWDFLMTLHDPRIKEIKKMDLNRGCTYNLNYVLAQRQKNQYFFHIDSDLHLISKDWITQFLEVMGAFPEVGMICAVGDQYLTAPHWVEKFIHREKDGISYEETPFAAGCCFGMSPQALDVVGYFNEETCLCDSDMNIRLLGYTSFKMGIVTTIKVSHQQRISCDDCPIKHLCTLNKIDHTCFKIRDMRYKSHEFVAAFPKRHPDYMKELEDGIRTVYCASMHDPLSTNSHYYNRQWAEENIQFYIDHSN